MKIQKKKKFISLIALIPFTILYSQSKFDEKTAFMFMLKNNSGMVNDYVQEYLYRFENEQYHIYANDEFECFRVTEQLTKSLSSLKNDNVYYIETKANFGIYDFTNESFEFTPVNTADAIEIVKYMFSAKGKSNSKIDVHLNNGDEIAHLPLKKEQANYLVKLKKNQKTGKIERVVDIRILFQVDLRTEIDNTNITRTKCDLYLNVLNIEVYDNPDFTAGAMISIPTIYKTQKDAGVAAKAQASK